MIFPEPLKEAPWKQHEINSVFCLCTNTSLPGETTNRQTKIGQLLNIYGNTNLSTDFHQFFRPSTNRSFLSAPDTPANLDTCVFRPVFQETAEKLMKHSYPNHKPI